VPEPTGRLITVEGIDGVGKTTHVNRLVHYLATRELEVTTYRDPGATVLGEQIRELAKAGIAHSPLAELLLFCAARSELVETQVKPDLAAGRFVILDRFTDSTLAYQGALGQIGEDTLRTVCQAAAGNLKPDLTLWLDLPLGEALERCYPRAQTQGLATDALDAIERRDRSYFMRVRQRYEDLANREPWRYVRIISTDSVDETAAAIRRAIDARLEEWLNG
jgi:dTMP kinase